jgi:hypothetical protein
VAYSPAVGHPGVRFKIMNIILILITFILAIIGWFKRDTIPLYVTIIVVALLILAAVSQITIGIQNSREKGRAKYVGVLQPKTKILLSVKKNIYPELELGDGGAVFSWRGREDEPMFKIFKDSYISILVEDGQLKVSAKLRNKNGVIAEIIKNEWKVNPNNIFDRNYSRNALEVKDNTGEIVLQVKNVGNRIQFQGKFYDDDGRGVGLGKHSSGTGGIIEITGTNHPQLELKIEPMFMYPSDLHLGELNKQKT